MNAEKQTKVLQCIITHRLLPLEKKSIF